MWDMIVDGVQWVFSWFFFAIGRGVTRTFGRGRSSSGWPETLLGFSIVVLVVLALIKLPRRLLALALVR